MRYPAFLSQNGTLGLAAPSFGCATEPYVTRLEAALREVRRLGLGVREAPHVRLAEAIGRSGPADVLARELTDLLTDPGVDAVWSVGGGETMCEVVPYLDFDALAKAPPKWYLGYSDNTNYTFLSATLADTAAIYGPCFPALGVTPWHPAVQDIWDLVTGRKTAFTGYPLWELTEGASEDPLAPLNLTERTAYRLRPAAEAVHMKGRLLGGCGDILYVLLGTRYDRVRAFNERYRADGTLWFLEFCDLGPLDVRRALWSMREAGWFDTAAGFLIGRPLRYGEEAMGLTMDEAAMGILEPLGVPVVFDADFGHLPPAMPLVTGALAEVTASREELEVRHLFA